MELQTHIKTYPTFWQYLPLVNQASGSTLYPYIFVTKHIYENLISSNPDPRYTALIKHEEIHLTRQKQIGVFKFILLYLFSPSFRLNEELLAYKVTFEELQKASLAIDEDTLSKKLSGPLYLWATSYKNAKTQIAALLDKAPTPQT